MTLQYLFYLIIVFIKLQTTALPNYGLKDLVNLSSAHSNL